jgi:cystathionine beta-lyase/cystathionine gamma-synthase
MLRLQVKCVHYPGLASHPRHDLVQELFSGKGAGGMVAFEVKDGAAADAVLKVRRLAGAS